MRDEWKGVTPYGEQVLKEIRGKLAAFCARKPNKEWAPRVLYRAANGADIAPHCLQMAKDVVMRMQQPREPGSDDE